MVYHDLQFPNAKKPYFYSNFVTTIDGKVQILTHTDDYWPLGSKLDYETLIALRGYADVLIHGSTTALAHPTLNSLSKADFHTLRRQNGKSTPILYIVVSNHPTDELIPKMLSTHPQVRTLLVTSEDTQVSDTLSGSLSVLRLGKDTVDLKKLSEYFTKENLTSILVEGGPTLMGSFFKENLIDELFVTIAPKIIGNEKDHTLTMVEGYLIPPRLVTEYELISHSAHGNELFLRYRRTNE